jgi:hypothetical protein
MVGRMGLFCSALQGQGYLVGRNCSFPKNLPRTIAGEIDDGGSNSAACGTAVHDKRNAIADLIANTSGVVALG